MAVIQISQYLTMIVPLKEKLVVKLIFYHDLNLIEKIMFFQNV
jgi:hypothetical protein